MLLISIAGNLINYSIFAPTFILVLIDSPTVVIVVNSVYENWRRLLATLILACIILYWYTIITFNFDFLRAQYHFEDEMHCTTLLNCLYTHFDYGFTVNPRWYE